MNQESYKGYIIKNDGTFSMKVISRDGSGKLPVSLSGGYTTSTVAKRDIDAFILKQEAPKRPKKVKLHAKTDQSLRK